MDRTISASVRWQRRLKRSLLPLGITAASIAAAAWGLGLLRPTLRLDELRVSVVDSGPLEAMVETSGIVLPEAESVISSPIATRVVAVLKQSGSPVNKGEPILELDTSETQLALQKLLQQLDLKRNQQRLVEQELEAQLITLNSQIEMAELELELKGAELERVRRLFTEKLVSRSELDRSQSELNKAELSLAQITKQSLQARRQTETQLAGLELEVGILDKELNEARRQAQLATTKSDRDGVITWILSDEGAAVQKGELLARIADLGSFYVEASVSDVYADRLSAGLPVVVKVNGAKLEGQVQRILPTITDGIMTLIVSLESSANSALRSNLRADVRVILDRKPMTLRLGRGPGIREAGTQDVFVTRGERAVKVRARFGIADFERVEVISGLSEGERVVVSDMSQYMHMESIDLN